MASPVYEDDDETASPKDQRVPIFNIGWKAFFKNEPLIVLGLVGTTVVLFSGLVNSFYFKNTKWDQRLMRARVIGQGLTIAFLGLGVFKMESKRKKLEEARAKRDQEVFERARIESEKLGSRPQVQHIVVEHVEEKKN
eukprot:TRINITY_DN463_c0_g1_i1.p1 TRINITY_DN463_c0_g1~~TRINITY_DN463_c0_g1_i1.p1  ORF type:complete len:138 (+),score=18.84 TRINITY_DN463_c0_g1_i1:108-521(+)